MIDMLFYIIVIIYIIRQQSFFSGPKPLKHIPIISLII